MFKVLGDAARFVDITSACRRTNSTVKDMLDKRQHRTQLVLTGVFLSCLGVLCAPTAKRQAEFERSNGDNALNYRRRNKSDDQGFSLDPLQRQWRPKDSIGKSWKREVTAQREVDYLLFSFLKFCHEIHIQNGHEVQLCLVENHFKHSFSNK